MDRRGFIKTTLIAGATLATRQALWSTEGRQSLQLRIDFSKKLAMMPIDFVGLSYESPQLSNPNYFCAENRQLIDAFRALSPKGVLRLGGSLSDFTSWSESPVTESLEKAAEKGRGYWEWKLTDPRTRQEKGLVITPAAIRTLREFLDATDWTLIYGLNFKTGTPEQAAKEAACVSRTLGPRLLAFQLGNEADFYADGYRPQPWEFQEYFADWQRFVKAVVQSVPEARFGGPDVAVRMDWVERLAQQPPKNLVFLSGHYYAMGPASDPKMTGDRLLQPDAKLANLIRQAITAANACDRPFRMTETNSCFGGGKLGVSDAYASALWVADYLLLLAQSGVAGVNLHGGGDGNYTAIAGDGDTFHLRPEFHGAQLAQKFCGHTFHPVSIASANSNVTAYCASAQENCHLAIFNKEANPATIQCLGIPRNLKVTGAVRMSSASLSSAHVEMSQQNKAPQLDRLEMPAYSATLVHLSGAPPAQP